MPSMDRSLPCAVPTSMRSRCPVVHEPYCCSSVRNVGLYRPMLIPKGRRAARRSRGMQRKVFDRKVFNRKLVVITGGCAGIGRALAVRMAQAGARLVIFDLHQDALDGLVQHLADHHNADALGLCCDVSDAEAVQRAIALVVERYGGIDVLVNNAGITHRSPVANTSLAVFERVMAVNFYGALHCTQAALPSLVSRGGQIIVLSSLSQYSPVPNRAAYNASKHALHGLFETLRFELRETDRKSTSLN